MRSIAGYKYDNLLIIKAIFVFVLFISAETNAQQHNEWFLSKVLDNNNGLLQNSVSSLYFDTKTGFLWMTTESGVVRYNGQESLVFDRRIVPDMKTVRMSAIFPTINEGIFVMDRGGMLYKIRDESIREVKSDSIKWPTFLNTFKFIGNFLNIKLANQILNNLLPNNEKDTAGKYDLFQFPLPVVWVNDSIWASYSTTSFKIFKYGKAIAQWEKSASEQPVLIHSGGYIYALNNNGSGYRIDPVKMT